MANFVQAIRLNKLPVVGLVPETSGTAPSSPVTGQLWTDTSTSPDVVRYWDGAAWQPWLIIGTASGQVPDASLVLLKANNLSDLGNATTARTNLGLGTAATQNKVAAGSAGVLDATDPTTTNQRVPTDASVTGGTAGAGVKIAAATITAANLAASLFDQAAGTSSLRQLSITSTTAAIPGGTTVNSIAAANAMTGALAMNNQKITGLGAPTAASDAARLVDVQGAAAGLDAQPSVRVASTANVPVATGLTNGQVVDGVTLVTGDRVLLKNQTTTSENGTYVVPASGAASRTTDNISANTFWFTEEGTTNADTQWVVTTNNPITVGSTGLVVTQFGAGTNYVGTSNHVTVTGNTIDISASYSGQASITTLGTVATGTWQATAVGILYGGTGATTAAGARTNLGVAQAGYAVTLGAVTAGTPYTVTHNLGTQDVIAQVRDASTNEYVYADVINASTNTVTVTTGISYGANALRIVVLPVL